MHETIQLKMTLSANDPLIPRSAKPIELPDVKCSYEKTVSRAELSDANTRLELAKKWYGEYIADVKKSSAFSALKPKELDALFSLNYKTWEREIGYIAGRLEDFASAGVKAPYEIEAPLPFSAASAEDGGAYVTNKKISSLTPRKKILGLSLVSPREEKKTEQKAISPEKVLPGFLTQQEYDDDPSKFVSDHLPQRYSVPLQQRSIDAVGIETKQGTASDTKASAVKSVTALGWNIYRPGNPCGYGERTFAALDLPTEVTKATEFLQSNPNYEDVYLAAIDVEIARMQTVAETIGASGSTVVCLQETPISIDHIPVPMGDDRVSTIKRTIINRKKQIFPTLIDAMKAKGYLLAEPSIGEHQLLTFVHKDSGWKVKDNGHAEEEVRLMSDQEASVQSQTLLEHTTGEELRVVNGRMSYSSSPEQFENEVIEPFRNTPTPTLLVYDANRGVVNSKGEFQLTNRVPSTSNAATNQNAGQVSYDSTDLAAWITPGEAPQLMENTVLDMAGQKITPALFHDQQATGDEFRNVIDLNNPFLRYLQQINAPLGYEVFSRYNRKTGESYLSFGVPVSVAEKQTKLELPLIGISNDQPYELTHDVDSTFIPVDKSGQEKYILYSLKITPEIQAKIGACNNYLQRIDFSKDYCEYKSLMLKARGPARHRDHGDGNNTRIAILAQPAPLKSDTFKKEPPKIVLFSSLGFGALVSGGIALSFEYASGLSGMKAAGAISIAFGALAIALLMVEGVVVRRYHVASRKSDAVLAQLKSEEAPYSLEARAAKKSALEKKLILLPPCFDMQAVVTVKVQPPVPSMNPEGGTSSVDKQQGGGVTSVGENSRGFVMQIGVKTAEGKSEPGPQTEPPKTNLPGLGHTPDAGD